jgi:hypothetical protein
VSWEHFTRNTLLPSRQGSRRSISPMLECAWSCRNSKLGSMCQQRSNNRSSMFNDVIKVRFRSWFHMLYPRASFGRNLAGNFRNISRIFALFKSILRFLPFFQTNGMVYGVYSATKAIMPNLFLCVTLPDPLSNPFGMIAFVALYTPYTH